MKNKKGLIFALIILMSVGFAAVTTTLIINGRTIVAENEEDYQVYFSGAIVDKEDYTNEIISKDKKTITFETKELMKENDTSELKYDVTNGSTQYDASVSIKVSKENDDLIEVTNTYDDSKNLSARETRTGVLTVRLKKGATEAKDVKIKVELIFNAEEREEIDNTPITSKVYSISGYFVDKEGNAMPNANIAVFSENPQFVTTDDYGYLYVGNLERGNHELYYIEKTDVNKTKEEIKKNAIDETNVTTSSTKTIVFDNGHEIKDKVVGEENNKTFKITLVKNNGEADEEIEVRENSKYENLPIPNKVGTKFLYWKDENGKIITENTIVSQTKTNKLYAYYGENTYRIAYNLNGGILNNQITQAKYGTEITLENPSKTIKVTINDNNEGSTISENEISKILAFKGWSGKDISGTALANGASWNGSIIKATTFKNLTDEQDKTVTLEANFEDTTITLPEVTKNGYTCKIKDGETTYEPSATYPIKGTDTNKELTVECGANTYKIVYNPNGGTGSMDATTCTYDKDCTLRANTFAKTGYTFDHWEVNAKTYKDQATVKNLAESGNVELKAIWKANTYKIAYNLKGGVSSNAPTGATYDKDVTIANPTKEVTVAIDGNNQGATLTKTSYTGNPVFTGWTGSSLSNTALVNNISWNGTLTKETKFKNLTSTLNGTVNLTANYNETSITLDAPTKTGYTCGYTDTATGAIKYTTSITVSDNKTIYVKCNPNTYTITFNSDGGTTVSSKTATYDSKIGTLTNPTKTGYNFAGWYLDTESITSESVYKYAKDITIKAKWTEATNTKYTVNYYLQTLDKKYDKVTESVVYTGTTNKTIDAALKTYEGFVTPSKQTVKILADGSAKVDYYYVRKELKVTFVNGDTKKEVTYLYGKENQAFTNNGFTKTGYTLTGYSNTSGGSKNYEVTSTVTGEFIDKHYPSKTVYVVFTANTYKIAFNNNGGTGSMDTITCTYDKDCTLTKNAFTKIGYTFAGWSKTSTGAIEYINGAIVKNLLTSGSITLYAKWTANTYTITYNANGGSGTTGKTTCTYDTNCTIAANSFTKTGYTFASWTKDSTTGTSYAVGSTVKNLATSGNVNMYAKWTTNTYKIAYTMNNGSLGTNKPTSASYDANVLIDNPTKNLTVTINANSQGATISKTSVSQAQTFNGWTVSGLNTSTAKTGTASNAITTAYTGSSTKNTYFKNLTATNNGTVTFTANWTNTAVTLPTITKKGYTCGYATSASGSIAYASGSKYTPNGETSKTLYAKCNANTYTITYNANGGSGTMSKTTCTYDTNCTLAANSFTKDGYAFVSWTKDSTSGTSYTAGSTVKNLATSGNVNMYAKWITQFENDSWSTIAANVKSGKTDQYKIGDTKTVDLGNLGTHTVRIANKSECTNGETSATACGFVVEFADIVTKQKFNSTKTNVGGWKDSELRTYINGTIYNALPSELQNVISSTKVISGHGLTAGEANFETQDKLYLLSNEEIYSDFASSSSARFDTSLGTSKQLDYYKNQGVTTSNYAGAIKQYNGSDEFWWLRSADDGYKNFFNQVESTGISSSYYANESQGVSPAFRLQGPTAFQKDDWATIAANVKSGNTSKYNVGDTKEVDLGNLGTHTVRIANKSECTNGETSETACGFVVEFADIITQQKFGGTVGGWKDSKMRTYINSTIYNALPSDLQNVIVSTKVISGYGIGETNFETQDKLYLLNAQEVWSTNDYDTSVGTSKQLDYYKNQGVTASSYAGAIKQYNGSDEFWWLRSTDSISTDRFLRVLDDGNWHSNNASNSSGVSPAFRLEGPWVPKYFAFGTPTTASATDYTTVGTKVFLALDTNNAYGVCINDNGLFCIKSNDYDNSVLALKNHFGESACSDEGSSFRCGSGAFYCNAYSNGGVDCPSPDACYVTAKGYIGCDGE